MKEHLLQKLLSVIIIILLIAAVSMQGFSAGAAEPEFVVNNGILIAYNGDSAEVTIPQGVYYIGESAFEGNTTLKTLHLNISVYYIGKKAFYGCTLLNVITHFGGVTSVGAEAFAGTQWLEEQDGDFVMLNSILLKCNSTKADIMLPANVASIGAHAFAGNQTIQSVEINENTSEIGEGAFYNCQELTSVIVPRTVSVIAPLAFENTKWLNTHKSDFVTVGDGILIKYKGTARSVSVPSGIRQIGGGAFYGLSLESVAIGKDVFAIGERAFMMCSALKSVVLDAGVRVIDKEAFALCTALGGIKLPDTVKTLGEGVFYGCSSLARAVTGNSVTAIPFGAFADCTALTSVSLGTGVAAVSDHAFFGAVSLTRISVWETGLSEISKTAFDKIDKLRFFCETGSFAAAFAEENGITCYNILCDDVNADRTVSLKDATLIQQHLAKVKQISDLQLAAADINGDLIVSLKDATQLQKRLAGIVV